MQNNSLMEKQKNSKTVYSGSFLTVKEDICILPNEKEAIRIVVEHPGAVAIIAVKEGNILLVEQYRYPISKNTWEIPAGKLDANEEPSACAFRELEEETGLRAKKITFLFSYYTTPGFSNELMYFYLAEDLISGNLKPDEDEFLNLKSIPVHEALAEIGKDKICDAKTIMALLWYKGHMLNSI